MVQKRETKAINKLCVREILSLSFVCGAYFFEFRGRNLVCFGIAYNFDWGRHMQIRAGSREGTHSHCVFHACRLQEVVNHYAWNRTGLWPLNVRQAAKIKINIVRV